MTKGQNRIDYIVYHQPAEAAKVLSKNGYQPPRSKEDLAGAVKLLVRKKGEPVIRQLMLIHPERKLLLESTGHSDESSYCGCQSSYTGELKDYLGHLSQMSVDELTELYDEAKDKSHERPDDKAMAGQVEMIWDELKRRKREADTMRRKEKTASENFMLYLALAFLAGVVVGKAA